MAHIYDPPHGLRPIRVTSHTLIEHCQIIRPSQTSAMESQTFDGCHITYNRGSKEVCVPDTNPMIKVDLIDHLNVRKGRGCTPQRVT